LALREGLAPGYKQGEVKYCWVNVDRLRRVSVEPDFVTWVVKKGTQYYASFDC